MPDILTRAEVEAIAERAIRSIPETRLDPKSVRKRGSTTNVLLVGAAGALAEEVQRRCVAKLAALTRAGARGAELDAVIAEQTWGQVARLGAQPSVATVQISRPTSDAGGGTVPAGTVCLAGGVRFTTDYPVPFGATQLGPLDVTVTASAAGSATNIAAGSISAWADSSALFDPTFTVLNADAAAGGEDAELDDDFIVRAQQFELALKRGTIEAIAFGIQQEAGVRNAVVEEDVASGRVWAYIADSNGNANQALIDRVQRRIITYRAAGIRVPIFGAIPTYVPIVLSPGYLDGAATLAVQDLARTAIVTAVNRTPPNTRLQRSLLFATLRSIYGLVVDDGAIAAPVGDLVPLPGQAFRTRADLVEFR